MNVNILDLRIIITELPMLFFVYVMHYASLQLRYMKNSSLWDQKFLENIFCCEMLYGAHDQLKQNLAYWYYVLPFLWTTFLYQAKKG
jgi:hypothetical protein